MNEQFALGETAHPGDFDVTLNIVNDPLARTKTRRLWLTELIREAHLQSPGTYGYRRVHAELTKGMGLVVSDRLVRFLMHDAGIRGLPHLTGKKPIRGIPTSDELVNRRFHRRRPNELWVTDITEHPTREGKVVCCCVLEAVAHSLNTRQRKTLRWKTPAEAFDEQLRLLQQASVASTG